MDQFLRICGGIMITVILGITLSKYKADVAVVVSILACCMVLTAMANYLTPVISFLKEIQNTANLDNQMVQLLFKAVGIGLIAEIAALICSDSGNGALGKSVQILASAVILGLCVPMMRSLLEMLERILGEL